MQTVIPFYQVTGIQNFRRFYPGDNGVVDLHVHSLKTICTGPLNIAFSQFDSGVMQVYAQAISTRILS